MSTENLNTMPATIAVEAEIANKFARCGKNWAIWRRRSKTRRMLATASSHILADVGITEEEREIEIKKYFWEK